MHLLEKSNNKQAHATYHGGLIQQLSKLLLFSFSQYFHMFFKQLLLLMALQKGSGLPAVIFA